MSITDWEWDGCEVLCVVLRRGKEKERERKWKRGEGWAKPRKGGEGEEERGLGGWVGGGAMMSDIRNAGS